MAALTAFSQVGLKEVALPAIGIGNLRFPISEMARATVAAVVGFMNSNSQTTLQSIQFVSYFDDNLDQVC